VEIDPSSGNLGEELGEYLLFAGVGSSDVLVSLLEEATLGLSSLAAVL